MSKLKSRHFIAEVLLLQDDFEILHTLAGFKGNFLIARSIHLFFVVDVLDVFGYLDVSVIFKKFSYISCTI